MQLVRSFGAPGTPPSGDDDETPAFGQPATAVGHQDVDEPGKDEIPPKRKVGGYTSRIEQILYENPDMSIVITDAGKSLESGGRHIVYTIRTGVGDCHVDAISTHKANRLLGP